MSWTDERVQLLKILWTQGLSASQIAARLGSVSRNAVIGKAHRLGLQGRPSPIRANPGGGGRKRVPPAKLREVVAALAAARQQAEAPPEPEPAPEPEPVLERPSARDARGTGPKGPQCSWPIGDPGDASFHFCPSAAEPGRPYCARHCELAYIRKDRTAA